MAWRHFAQSLEAVHIDGVISIIGFVAGTTAEKPLSFLELLKNFCCMRGVSVCSRAQREDMNQAIEANDIKPVVDGSIFEMEYFEGGISIYVGAKALWKSYCQDRMNHGERKVAFWQPTVVGQRT